MNRRGKFEAIATRISFGQGQTVNSFHSPFCLTNPNQTLVREFLEDSDIKRFEDSDIKRLAGFAHWAFESYNKNAYNMYNEALNYTFDL
jgi:hypothetical protein